MYDAGGNHFVKVTFCQEIVVFRLQSFNLT